MKKPVYETHVQKGILLNANENSENLTASLLQEIKDALDSILFNRYPDPGETELLESYAKAMELSASMLLAGNGSDQMLGYVIGYYLKEGKTLYTFDPDFSMYEYYAGTYGASVKKFAISEEKPFDTEGFIQHGKELNVDMIMFSNPNNPSGICLPIETIEKIIQAFPNIPVIVDEAYFEFADETSAISLIDQYENLLVTRTLSKAYGLAGLRIGFLIANEGRMEELKKAFVPYALNSFSMKAACIVLQHKEHMEQYVQSIKQERKRMMTAASAFKKMQLFNSQTNFLYGKAEDKEKLLDLFGKQEIVIRNYAGSNAFRITIGTKEENDKVLEVLRQFEVTE